MQEKQKEEVIMLKRVLNFIHWNIPFRYLNTVLYVLKSCK